MPPEGGFSQISDRPHHDIWFSGGGRIGSITSDGTCALRGCPTVTALAEGPEGALWFAGEGTVGRFDLVTDNTRKVTIDLTGAAASQLTRDGKLPVRLPARIRGKVSATRTTVLRGAR